jgi:hypothetical protein
LSLEAASFLSEKEFLRLWKILVLLDFMDFRGNPLCFHSMFPINSSLLKCANNTNIGHTSSMKKEKKIHPFAWKIGEIFVKNISHLDEFTTQFDHFNLKEVHAI